MNFGPQQNEKMASPRNLQARPQTSQQPNQLEKNKRLQKQSKSNVAAGANNFKGGKKSE